MLMYLHGIGGVAGDNCGLWTSRWHCMSHDLRPAASATGSCSSTHAEAAADDDADDDGQDDEEDKASDD